MIPTLMTAVISDRSMAPVRGLISAIRIRKVSSTTIWATMRFSLLNPPLRNSKTRPTAAGISAVTEGDSEPKYPQSPRSISKRALIKLISEGFIANVIIIE